MITTNSKNDQQRPLKSSRTWFKFSFVNRFVQSFSKNSQQQQQQQNSRTNFLSKKKTQTERNSTEIKQFSDYIY